MFISHLNRTVSRIMEDQLVMEDATKRSILRWIHIVFPIPILGYIYSSFEKLPSYAFKTRFVFVPVIVLSGLWMWKGHVLRLLVLKGPALQVIQADPLKGRLNSSA